MGGMRKKLASKRGESLAEALVSILLAALSLLMLSAMISSSVRLGGVAEEEQTRLYALQAAAEEMSAPVGERVAVTVREESADYAVEVSLYGGSELYSYGEEAGG